MKFFLGITYYQIEVKETSSMVYFLVWGNNSEHDVIPTRDKILNESELKITKWNINQQKACRYS